MPLDPEDAATRDVLYPDELEGEALVLDEYAYYDADDEADREELPEAAQYGLWLRVSPVGVDDGETWIAAPRSLREALYFEEAEEGDAFRVLSVERGEAEHDPYEVDIEYPYHT